MTQSSTAAQGSPEQHARPPHASLQQHRVSHSIPQAKHWAMAEHMGSSSQNRQARTQCAQQSVYTHIHSHFQLFDWDYHHFQNTEARDDYKNHIQYLTKIPTACFRSAKCYLGSKWSPGSDVLSNGNDYQAAWDTEIKSQTWCGW